MNVVCNPLLPVAAQILTNVLVQSLQIGLHTTTGIMGTTKRTWLHHISTSNLCIPYQALKALQCQLLNRRTILLLGTHHLSLAHPYRYMGPGPLNSIPFPMLSNSTASAESTQLLTTRLRHLAQNENVEQHHQQHQGRKPSNPEHQFTPGLKPMEHKLQLQLWLVLVQRLQ